MEGERAPFLFGHARMSRRKKRDVGEEEDGYKYPLSPNDHLNSGSASLQVWQCRTTQDSKSKSVGVSNKHRLVNLYLMRVRPGWCANGHKVYTGSG